MTPKLPGIPQPKPGWKTTEWGGFLLVVILAALISFGAVTEADSLVKIGIMVGTGLASGLYSISRSVVKTPPKDGGG